MARQLLEDEVYVRGNSKACPACGAAISKDGGCNKVTCGFCYKHMCWTCNKTIRGYEHFRGGCVLFDEAQLRAWEVRWNQMVLDEQALQEQGGGHRRVRRHYDAGVQDMQVLRCPRCGRLNPKQGRNNHVKCMACATDACFVCHGMLQGPRAVRTHFGGSAGCPQHS